MCMESEYKKSERLMNMSEFTNVTALTKELMENEKQCCCSDSILYLRVITTIANRNGMDIESMTVPYFLENLHGAGFPGFETVRRARQKLQAQFPHLAANKTVAAFRAKNEKKYRAFAREKL